MDRLPFSLKGIEGRTRRIKIAKRGENITSGCNNSLKSVLIKVSFLFYFIFLSLSFLNSLAVQSDLVAFIATTELGRKRGVSIDI